MINERNGPNHSQRVIAHVFTAGVRLRDRLDCRYRRYDIYFDLFSLKKLRHLETMGKWFWLDNLIQSKNSNEFESSYIFLC